MTDSLESQALYYKRVRSSNITEWSAVWQFTTYTPVTPGQIRSFAIINGETPNSLKLLFSSDDEIGEIIAFLSSDGLSFTDTVQFDAVSPLLTGLEANQIYYIRLKGSNSASAGSVSIDVFSSSD